MILNNSIRAGNFVYCLVYWSPHEESSYFNDGNGHYHPNAYVVDGQGWAEFKDADGNVYISEPTKTPGTLVDTSHSRGKYEVIKTDNHGLSLFHVNPIPAELTLNIEYISGAQERELTPVDNRITVVVVTGPVYINNKKLESLQHAKIFPGKTATVTLGEHSICALVSEAAK
jgi:hypothetical protein